MDNSIVKTQKTKSEISDCSALRRISQELQGQIQDQEWNLNQSLLFTNRQTLSRTLNLNDLYSQIIDVPGVICEFGVRLKRDHNSPYQAWFVVE